MERKSPHVPGEWINCSWYITILILSYGIIICNGWGAYVSFALLCMSMYLCVLCSVLCCSLWFLLTNHVRFVLTSSCLQDSACLTYVMCVCLRIVAFNKYWFYFCFVFLRLVCPMLPISLDCPFLIARSVFSIVFLIA